MLPKLCAQTDDFSLYLGQQASNFYVVRFDIVESTVELLVQVTKVNLHSTLCGNELGKNVKIFQKIVETFPHGPLIRGVFKEFIFSKIA